MKPTIYAFVALLATTIAGILPATAQKAGAITDTVLMGSSYTNEVYYSMSAGKKGAVSRKLWDIAFRASRQSASILTNDGAGVELYAYPKGDTSAWATVDTVGLYKWKNLVNSTTDWETGAFCQNQKGHPDYGWGRYNAFSHNVVGDSLFIIRLRDGSLRKIWIKEKYSSNNIFEIRFANLNGTDDNTVMLDCNPYIAKNFVGYSISTKQLVDFEPVPSTDWDLLFTKYIYTYPDGTPYPVTGVLSNYGVKVNKFEHVSPALRTFDFKTMFTTRSPIGWEWKSFSNATFTYKVQDSLVFFVQEKGGSVFKLVFKEFAGSSTGRIVLSKEKVSFTGLSEPEKSGFNAVVYPNPVRDVMNLVINPGKSESALLSLLDVSGRVVFSKKYELNSETLSTLRIPLAQLTRGMYVLRIQSGANAISRKVVVNN